MPLSFSRWEDNSAYVGIFVYLYQQDDIFEPQRGDGDRKEDVRDTSFPGAYLAIASENEQPTGFILYTPRPNGVFEQHTGFLKPHRGEYAEGVIREATAKMFTQTPCSQIVTFCPEWLAATRALAKRMGAHYLFTKAPFVTREGTRYSAELWGQTALQWAWKNHHTFEKAGAKWHDEVFAAIEPHHEDDPAHNGFLGLALEMGKRQPHKAIAIYNAWAELAGYAPGALIWADGQGNSLIDIGNAMVLNGPDGVRAVIPKCPPQPQLPQPPEQLPAQG